MNLNQFVLIVGVVTLPVAGFSQTSYTINNSTADAFLSGTNPTLNYGAAGTLAIAPASSSKGEFDSVVLFNTASAVSQFNTTYGAGNWTITGLMLSLSSNFGIQGEQPSSSLFNTINAGSFGVDWLSYDAWVEGTGGGSGTAGYPGNSAVSFDSIPTLMSGTVDSLGTYTYTPAGNNNNTYLNYSLALNANLVADAAAGGNVSLYFYAADNQFSYLFNSRSFSTGHPELTLTAAPVPEPAALALAAAGLGTLLVSRRIKK
jgi:hypothetical protein